MVRARSFALCWLWLAAACGTPTASATSDVVADSSVVSGDTAIGGEVVEPDDGPPTPKACTTKFGSALTTAHGRMDGYLVAVVPPTYKGCKADLDHLHLQVLINKATYDVAVNVGGGSGVLYAARDLPVAGGPWTEGWHPFTPFDYVQQGLHSDQFAPLTTGNLVDTLTAELKTANHISVFAYGYGHNGAHLVHFNGPGHDGAIVVRPLSGKPRYLMFRFPDQTF